jgi:hypothetical protein
MKVVVTSESPIVRGYMDELGFTQFDGSLNKDFGFEQSFRLERQCPDGFNEFVCKLPRVDRETGKLCSTCKGTGKDWKQYDFQCFECRGGGKERALVWDKVYASPFFPAWHSFPIGEMGHPRPRFQQDLNF